MAYQKFGAVTDNGLDWYPNLDTIYAFSPTFDSYLKQPRFAIFILADGMAGHHGQTASGLAAKAIAAYLIQKIYLKILDDADNNTVEEASTEQILVEAVELGNTVVRNEPGGGVVLTLVLIDSEMIYIASVGDCRAYWVSKEGHIHQITRDHTVVQRLIELDKMKPEEAAESDQKHVLYRALGMGDEIEVDIFTQTFSSQSHLLLCSKGLWHMVSDDEIAQIVKNSVDPQQTCDMLVRLANKYGGKYNMSVILIPFD